MAEYRFSSLAESDLAEIADYTIEGFGIDQARRYRDALDTCFQTLADNSKIGRSADQLTPDLRRYEHQSHVVFYVPEGEGVLIVRVLHESMDVSRHF